MPSFFLRVWVASVAVSGGVVTLFTPHLPPPAFLGSYLPPSWHINYALIGVALGGGVALFPLGRVLPRGQRAVLVASALSALCCFLALRPVYEENQKALRCRPQSFHSRSWIDLHQITTRMEDMAFLSLGMGLCFLKRKQDTERGTGGYA